VWYTIWYTIGTNPSVRTITMTTIRQRNEGSARKEAALTALKRAIVSAVIRPGSPLSERELSDRYHLSRTPVREILQRLHYEGLVELIPNRGAFVRRLTAEDLVDVFYAREAIEGMAARLAAERHRPDQLVPIVRAFSRLRVMDQPEALARMVRAGRMLHDFVVDASGNQPLQRAYASLRNETMLVRSITQAQTFMKSPPPEIFRIEQASYHDHLRILSAVRARRAQEAEQAMRHHLRATRERLLGQIFRRAWGD
jgi:DNA-binding GntR family transcriptional regulator